MNDHPIIRIQGRGSWYWIIDGYYLMHKMPMHAFRTFWRIMKRYAQDPEQVRAWIIGYSVIYQFPDRFGMVRRKVGIVE